MLLLNILFTVNKFCRTSIKANSAQSESPKQPSYTAGKQ